MLLPNNSGTFFFSFFYYISNTLPTYKPLGVTTWVPFVTSCSENKYSINKTTFNDFFTWDWYAKGTKGTYYNVSVEYCTLKAIIKTVKKSSAAFHYWKIKLFLIKKVRELVPLSYFKSWQRCQKMNRCSLRCVVCFNFRITAQFRFPLQYLYFPTEQKKKIIILKL